MFPLDAEHMGIVVGDVTDKGVPAAIYMAQTRALLRAKASSDFSPTQTLEMINRLLLDTNDSGMFVTMIYGKLNLRTGKFVYARGGHEIPLVLEPSGNTLSLPYDAGVPLGIMEKPMLDQQQAQIRPGELMLLYTDGVTDGLNLLSDGVGTDELQKLMSAGNGLGAQEFCEFISCSIVERQDGKPQFDDITLLAIRSAA